MYQFKQFFFVTILLFVKLICAQSTVVQGIIKDNTGSPLSDANIIFKPSNNSNKSKFVVSDAEGFYSLKLSQNQSYIINVYYLGFETINYELNSIQNRTLDFILKPNPTKLEEVQLNFELPIIVKEDTTTYNVDAFNKGNERKLKDVLSNLPGIEVEENGEVLFQGKKVTDLLVEDSTFFNGGTKLGVENIPSDAVDKIQVFENYNSISFLKGFSDQESVALNIKLKEGKKKFVFGDLEAGKGNSEFYKGEANLFYYSPKTSVNAINNINNIGDKVFTFSDYLNFQGGVNAVFRGDFDFKDETLTQFLEVDEYLSRHQKFSAFNISRTTSSKFNISSYFILNTLETSRRVQSFNQYTNFTENQTSNTKAETVFGLGNIKIDITPNSKLKILSKTQFKQSDLDKNNVILSEISNDVYNFDVKNKAKPLSINQSIELHNEINSNHTFSFLGDYYYNKNNNSNFWQSNTGSFSNLIPIISQSIIKIDQLKEIEEQNLNFIFKHFWLLNRTNHIYSTLSFKNKKEFFYTNEEQALEDNSINRFSNSEFGNDLKYRIKDASLGIHYKFKKGIFTIKQGITFHNYIWNINQSEGIKKKIWQVLPDLRMEIELNKAKKIELDYSLNTAFSNAKGLSNRFLLESYNSVFKGNQNLENELFHSANINYRTNSLYRGLSLFANINYTKKIRGYVNNVNFNDVNQFLSLALLDNSSESFSFKGYIHKKINRIKFKLDGNIRKASFLQQIDTKTQVNNNNSTSLELRLETFFKNPLNLETGFKKTLNTYESRQKTTFVIDRFFLNAEYNFLETFDFSIDYEILLYQNVKENQKNKYETLRFMFSYQRENSAWNFNLVGRNILNLNSKQTNSFSNYLISDIKESVLPLILMFKIGYKL